MRSYLERDVPMFAPRLPAETIGRLWTMLAHAQASPLNQSRLAANLEVATPAIARYINLLVDLAPRPPAPSPERQRRQTAGPASQGLYTR